MNENLAAVLLRAADARGSDPAIDTALGASTFDSLRARAGAVARALRDSGLAPGDRVAVLLDRSADAAATIFGIHAGGGVAVVLNERLRPRQIEHALADSGAALLLSTSEFRERVGEAATMLREFIEVERLPSADLFAPVRRGATDLAHIIYTSGSTGLPKGVMHSHGSIAAGVATVAAYLALGAADRVAGLLALSSVYGLNQLLCSVAVGATYVPERSTFAADVVAALRARRVTVVAGVPPLWTQLLAVPEFTEPLPHLRQLQNAGGHLPVESVRRLRAAQPQAELFLQYGMTETWRGTFLPPTETDRRPGSMGRPIPGAEILVLREDGSPCDADEIGELAQAGPTLALGYWGAPAGTDETFRPHPTRARARIVHSGDQVRRDAEGFLYYVGRRDRIIKTMGHRVGPDEVADVLLASGQAAEAIVAGEPDPERGQRIVAWVVLVTGGSLQQLKRHARAELPPHMLPSRIEVLEQLPRLSSGKYDLAELQRTAPAPPARS